MDLDEKKFKLTSNEFVMKTGTTKSGQVFKIVDLINDRNNKSEAWSVKIIKEVFKQKISILNFGLDME